MCQSKVVTKTDSTKKTWLEETRTLTLIWHLWVATQRVTPHWQEFTWFAPPVKGIFSFLLTSRAILKSGSNDVISRKVQNTRKLKQYMTGTPWERNAIDIFGWLPTTDPGIRYPLLSLDYFSKYQFKIKNPHKSNRGQRKLHFYQKWKIWVCGSKGTNKFTYHSFFRTINKTRTS